jgi:hypothetical protein
MMRLSPAFAPVFIAVGLGATILATPQALAWDRMDPDTIASMSDKQVLDWSLHQIGQYLDLISAAAKRHRLPPRLLATCILNELSDYGLEDQLQEVFFSTGSVGMAQMQVLRAVEYHRVDVSAEDLDACESDTLAREPLGVSAGEAREYCRRYVTWERLNQPNYAVEAAARELDWILDTMNANLARPWQERFLSGPVDRDNPYAHVLPLPSAAGQGSNARDAVAVAREQALAVGVCTAYNAPSIMKAQAVVDEDGREGLAKNAFRSARRHGRRAARLAALLARGQVFQPTPAATR